MSALTPAHVVEDGPWTYTRTTTWGTYTARNADTDEEFDTGATTIPEVRRVMYNRHVAAKAAAAPSTRYTVERGSRARAGHQRYRGGEERTA